MTVEGVNWNSLFQTFGAQQWKSRFGDAANLSTFSESKLLVEEYWEICTGGGSSCERVDVGGIGSDQKAIGGGELSGTCSGGGRSGGGSGTTRHTCY